MRKVPRAISLSVCLAACRGACDPMRTLAGKVESWFRSVLDAEEQTVEARRRIFIVPLFSKKKGSVSFAISCFSGDLFLRRSTTSYFVLLVCARGGECKITFTCDIIALCALE